MSSNKNAADGSKVGFVYMHNLTNSRIPFALYLLVVILGMVTLILSCSDEEGAVPNLRACACNGVTLNIVCGSDGRTYLDSCFALCVGVPILASGNCPEADNNFSDTLRWPIESVCIPLATPDDPQPLSTLGDGSVIYENKDGTIFRGTPNFCRCLPAATLITTPDGQVPIDQLRTGDWIISLNEEGDIAAYRVDFIRKVPIPPDYNFLHIRLEDDRTLLVSPQHPTALGRPLLELEIGDCLDGSIVIEKSFVTKTGTYTWDILPDAPNPVYFANKILIGSTIQIPNKKNESI